MRALALVVMAAGAGLLIGCGDDDGGSGPVDAGHDAGTTVDDAGLDAGSDGGVDAGPEEDAGPGASLGCYDTALPTPPDTLNITFKFHIAGTAIPDGSVQVRWRADDSLVAEGTSDEEGTFSFSVDTGGEPADVYVVFEAAGRPKHILYTGWPLYEDELIRFMVYSDEIIGPISDMTGITPDDTAGQIHVTARDCALLPLEQAEFVLSSDPELLVYVVGEICADVAEDLSETGSCGSAVALNVAAGTVDVSGALVDGPELHTQSVVVEAGAITRLTMRPRRL